MKQLGWYLLGAVTAIALAWVFLQIVTVPVASFRWFL